MFLPRFAIHICISKVFLIRQVGTPRTHRRYLARDKGTYGPMPRGTPKGLLGMPFNTTVSQKKRLDGSLLGLN